MRMLTLRCEGRCLVGRWMVWFGLLFGFSQSANAAPTALPPTRVLVQTRAPSLLLPQRLQLRPTEGLFVTPGHTPPVGGPVLAQTALGEAVWLTGVITSAIGGTSSLVSSVGILVMLAGKHPSGPIRAWGVAGVISGALGLIGPPLVFALGTREGTILFAAMGLPVMAVAGITAVLGFAAIAKAGHIEQIRQRRLKGEGRAQHRTDRPREAFTLLKLAN